jgi:hypothetical protein
MQTPVRYYITRDDDRPVVRSIPVSMRPEPSTGKLEEQVPVVAVDAVDATNETAPRKRVKTLVRSAVRRQTHGK